MKFGDFVVYEINGKVLLGRVGITEKSKIRIIPEEKNRKLVNRKIKNVILLDKLIKRRDKINEKKHPEHDLQVTIHKELKKFGIFHFSVPNGQKRGLRIGMSLKAEGSLRGVSDLIILLPTRCIFVEVKNGEKGIQSKWQKDFQNKVQSLGFGYFIWKNMKDCNDFIENVIRYGLNYKK